MPVSLLLIYIYIYVHCRVRWFFSRHRNAYGDNSFDVCPVSAFFYSRPGIRYDVRFISSILNILHLFSDERINEETSFKIIVSIDLEKGEAKISDKLSIFVTWFVLKLFIAYLFYFASCLTFSLVIVHLITVYVIIAIYRAELFPSLSVNRFIVFTDLQILFVQVYNFMIGLWIVWDFPEHRWD